MVTVVTAPDGSTVTIKPEGRLDGKIHREFQEAFSLRAKPTNHYIVDLGRTDYIDSAGLGMLLKLRAYAGGDKAKVRLVNCSPGIKKILTIANFHSLLTIE